MSKNGFDLDRLCFEIAIGSQSRLTVDEGLLHLGYRRISNTVGAAECVECWEGADPTTPTLFIADEEPLLRYEAAILQPGVSSKEFLATRERALGSLPGEPLYALLPAAASAGITYLASTLLHATNATQIAYTLGGAVIGATAGALAAQRKRRNLAEEADRRLEEMSTLYICDTRGALEYVFGLPSYSSRLRRMTGTTDPGSPPTSDK